MTEPTPDAWHDNLLDTIRERAQRNETQLNAHSPNPHVYNWPEVSSRLNQATTVALAQEAPLVGPHHTGLRRIIVGAIRRLIVTLSRFLTNRQSEYNISLVDSMR